jgi:hypothetical protein
MLTIVDLHQEEELSSSSMRKVAGGEEPIPGGGNGSRSEAGPEGPGLEDYETAAFVAVGVVQLVGLYAVFAVL